MDYDKEDIDVTRNFQSYIVSISDISWSLDQNGNYTYISPNITQLIGYPTDYFIGKSILHLTGDQEKPGLIKDFNAILKACEPFALLKKIKVKNSDRIIIFETNGIPVFDSKNAFTGYRGIDKDITDRIILEDRLHLLDERMREAQIIANIGSWDWNIVNNNVWWSDQTYRIFGARPQEFPVHFETFFNFIKPEDRPSVAEAVKLAHTNKKKYDLDSTIIRQDGVERIINVQGKVFFDKDKKAVRMSGTCQDITERKNSEFQIKRELANKNTLLKELYHRTKNNMQVISSMIQLRTMAINDQNTQNILNDIDSKIQSMSLVHSMLYKSKDLSLINLQDYVTDLVDMLKTGLYISDTYITFSIDCEPILLLIDIVLPLGLIINELITNSVKHAFPGNRHGTISIHIKKQTNGLELLYSDNGKGVPEGYDFKSQSTLGMQLLTSIIEQQLRGSLELLPQEGFACKINITYKPRTNKIRID